MKKAIIVLLLAIMAGVLWIERKAKKIGIKPTKYIFSLIANDLNCGGLKHKND